jgi:AcrR family transcriptional regulator
MTPPAATTKRTLSTAEERREAVLEAAMRVFAARGIHGTPTLEVAKAAGISQAYLFRLFPTKADLAIALVKRCNDRVYGTFAEAAARARAAGEDVLEAMGHTYAPLMLENPELLAVTLHAYAAAEDEPAIRDAMRSCFGRLVELAERESGASSEEIRRFFAYGMLINVMAALGAHTLDEHWAHVLTASDPEAKS